MGSGRPEGGFGAVLDSSEILRERGTASNLSRIGFKMTRGAVTGYWIDAPVAHFVGIGQRAFRHVPPNFQVVQLGGLRTQAGDRVAQTCARTRSA